MLKATYDRKADTVYVSLNERADRLNVYGKLVGLNRCTDFDADGRAVGVEFFHASDGVDLDGLAITAKDEAQLAALLGSYGIRVVRQPAAMSVDGLYEHLGMSRDDAEDSYDAILGRLVRAKGIQRFAEFWGVGEGRDMPNGLEVTSGFLVAEDGRVYSFWMDWDFKKGEPVLSRWHLEDIEYEWALDPEYQRAVAKMKAAP